MNLVIDTNRLSDFFQNDEATVGVVSLAQTVYIPVIVAGEYKYGIYAGTRKQQGLKLLADFLALTSCQLLVVDESTTEHYAALKAYLRKIGKPIPENDLWIAALCVQHDLPLLTRDQDFDHLPQVQRI